MCQIAVAGSYPAISSVDILSWAEEKSSGEVDLMMALMESDVSSAYQSIQYLLKYLTQKCYLKAECVAAW